MSWEQLRAVVAQRRGALQRRGEESEVQIKRLRLTGFKSFVDPADLRIEPGLTGIVGPNGCGKSNLLEALRWVMGENSAQSMRGGGMEDVIFAGTATRPRAISPRSRSSPTGRRR